MSFNLINQISAEDKVKIENYISLYGVRDGFIGLDAWLKHWSDNKIKMYKMLGNQLIYRTPFEYKKTEDELKNQLNHLVREDPFYDIIMNWIYDNKSIFSEEYSEVKCFIAGCLDSYALKNDSICHSIKIKLEESNKTFQIQSGAKPIRALGRFLTYCKNIYGVEEVVKAYEKFRIVHSMIFNDKLIKGTLAISIHPLDFMTMSDNNSNWHSCMSWMEEGCYHVGTVEMMNSNNVLCCYIENSEPFYFSEEGKDRTEEYRWTNKKWRQLVYFTKDIIVSGKPYPYSNDNVSKSIIEIIRNLAKENLKWSYSFGPELYRDMIHINGNFSMNRAKKYIKNNNTTKFNIIFDTKGMYNDMLNDSKTKYWCVRNKVKHTKVISYSGKASCLCCGGSVICVNEEPEDDYSDYNERYSNTGVVICDDCLDTKFKCGICGCNNSREKHFPIIIDGVEQQVCKECLSNYIKECPSCGEPMFVPFFKYSYRFVDRYNRRELEFIKLKEEIDEDEFRLHGSYWADDCYRKEWVNKRFTTIYPICRCEKCAAKDEDNFEYKRVDAESFWEIRSENFLISKNVQNKTDWDKYFFYNLKDIDLEKNNIVSR